jgi:antitoxin (DNA-binding transcriptional repressor) of toxin-antitoxin stability system
MSSNKHGSHKSGPTPIPLDATKVIEVGAGVFKDTCLSLMDKVRDERAHVVITKHGNAVARLVPADVEVPSGLGFMRGTVVKQGDIVSPDFEPWDEI